MSSCALALTLFAFLGSAFCDSSGLASPGSCQGSADTEFESGDSSSLLQTRASKVTEAYECPEVKHPNKEHARECWSNQGRWCNGLLYYGEHASAYSRWICQNCESCIPAGGFFVKEPPTFPESYMVTDSSTDAATQSLPSVSYELVELDYPCSPGDNSDRITLGHVGPLWPVLLCATLASKNPNCGAYFEVDSANNNWCGCGKKGTWNELCKGVRWFRDGLPVRSIGPNIYRIKKLTCAAITCPILYSMKADVVNNVVTSDALVDQVAQCCEAEVLKVGDRVVILKHGRENEGMTGEITEDRGTVAQPYYVKCDAKWCSSYHRRDELRKAPTDTVSVCKDTYVVDIGKSVSENKKCVTQSDILECEGDAGHKGKRINFDDLHHYDDTFEITVEGQDVCARRTDKSDGWSMMLKIRCAKTKLPPGENKAPPTGYVAKADSGPCRCRGSSLGLDSCGDLCCAASPWTDPDPAGQYYYGKNSKTQADMCYEKASTR